MVAGVAAVDGGPREVVRYWHAVEMLSPQPLPEFNPVSAERPVVKWDARKGSPLPWDALAPARANKSGQRRVWQHTVYVGVYDLAEVYGELHRMFPADEDAYNERPAGVSSCAAFFVDSFGRLVPGSCVLSSALWSLGHLKETVDSATWTSSFSAAHRQFADDVAAYLGAAQHESGETGPGSLAAPKGGDDATMAEAPRVGGDAVSDIRVLAQDIAGIRDLGALSTTSVRIASAPVRAGSDTEPREFDFLNSFYLEELGMVARTRNWGPALGTYLLPDAHLRPAARVDVRQQPESVVSGTSIDRLPLGRWLSSPDQSLASSQQFAVNQAMNDVGADEPLLGVNGPPGSGKTTMLRDLVAGNVVERAMVLAGLSHPDAAFTGVTHRWKSGDYPRQVPQLREDLTGFEMVVASSNNAAVANVSDELPQRAQIADRWLRADYFGDLATEIARRGHDGATGTGPAWGLVAARLGNAKNRNDFAATFWFGAGVQTQLHDPAKGVVHGMQQLLKLWAADPGSRPSWAMARERFTRARQAVLDLLAERQRASDRLSLQASLVESGRAYLHDLSLLDESARMCESGLVRARAEEPGAQRAAADARTRRERHVQTRPGWWEVLRSLGRVSGAWRDTLAPLEEELTRCEDNERAAAEDVSSLESELAALHTRCAQVRESSRHVRAESAALTPVLEADRARFGIWYQGAAQRSDDVARELIGPWLDPDLNSARRDLFVAALELHRAFLANATGVAAGLRAAREVVVGAVPADLSPLARRASWQLQFLAVPLISTTFASVGRMFRGLEGESLGWLFIDEAGQAAPQAAVGAIWRARRVLAVGDPMQLTPVITVPTRTQYDIAGRFGVGETWVPSRTSVQGLADRVGRFGTTLHQGEEPVWVSSPLRVHRRCDNPMFEISNAVAYEGLMIHGVDRRPGDRFDRIAGSAWLSVPNVDRGTHLQRSELSRLAAEVSALLAAGLSGGDIIAISPFRDVARALSELVSDFPGMTGGTIHTAQGREADVVFLVLGGDPDRPGAKRWASRTPNLVNVAVSRAKRRLYVIGDHDAWVTYPYFDILATLLTKRR